MAAARAAKAPRGSAAAGGKKEEGVARRRGRRVCEKDKGRVPVRVCARVAPVCVLRPRARVIRARKLRVYKLSSEQVGDKPSSQWGESSTVSGPREQGHRAREREHKGARLSCVLSRAATRCGNVFSIRWGCVCVCEKGEVGGCAALFLYLERRVKGYFGCGVSKNKTPL